MSGIFDGEDDAATPLSEDEKDGLLPSYITLRSELNEAEQANILEGEAWADRRNRDVLDPQFLDQLHKRMFGHVWKWAGTHRTTGKNIGIEPYLITTELRLLCDDCKFWIENETYPPDEIAARFHHRLVQIHCYPNGNGRHARLGTDLLLKALGQPAFTWGSTNLADTGDTRQRYIAALKAADGHDMGPLLAFVRS